MDEPFGALDPVTRGALQEEIARIHGDSRTTIVFVTHDIDEALKLASRIAILEQGRLVQVGTPLELLAAPATDFVRDFVGRDDHGIRLLSVEPVSNRLRAGEGGTRRADRRLREPAPGAVADDHRAAPTGSASSTPAAGTWACSSLRISHGHDRGPARSPDRTRSLGGVRASRHSSC